MCVCACVHVCMCVHGTFMSTEILMIHTHSPSWFHSSCTCAAHSHPFCPSTRLSRNDTVVHPSCCWLARTHVTWLVECAVSVWLCVNDRAQLNCTMKTVFNPQLPPGGCLHILPDYHHPRKQVRFNRLGKPHPTTTCRHINSPAKKTDIHTNMHTNIRI